jgi:putative ABC transport system permease protein
LRVMPPTPRYDDPAAAVALYQRLAEAVAAVPGVSSVALTNHMPLTGAAIGTPVVLEGGAAESDSNSALFRTVSPGYFATMQIPVVRGRPLTSGDLTRSSPSMLINQAFARRYWPHDEPIGKRVTVLRSVQARPDFGKPVDGTVVGVVGDVRHYGLAADFEPEVYLPYTVDPPRWISLIVRTRGVPAPMIPALRRAVQSVDPDIPLLGDDLWTGFATMEQFLTVDLAPQHFSMTVVGAFAASALLLALVGLYGVMSFLVTQRTGEIAVRLAVGARDRDVLKLVLSQALRLTAIGVGLGLVASLVVTRLMSSLLFQVPPVDPVTFAAVAILLAGVALLASYIPAWRASRVEPMCALRAE